MPACGPPVCAHCGMEIPGAFDAVLSCARCRRQPPLYEAARAPWRYEGLARQAIGAFKYHHHLRLGRWLADAMAQAAVRSLPIRDIAAVVPVPLHWLKRHLRGRNPTEELAREVAARLNRRCLSQALSRVRWTSTQTRLSARQRARNVRDAFAARRRLVRGLNVLLIDDVVTSGATANACARALKAAGARKVFVLAAARTGSDPKGV